MKKHFPIILLTLIMAFGLLPPNALASEGGGTKTFTDSDKLWQEIANAQDGDTFNLVGICIARDPSSQDAPLVINKAITFQGGTLVFRTGGVILNADVTFRNMTLSFPGFVRTAIMANGHTLTLEDVQCDTGANSFSLFCGGLYDPGGFHSTPGPAGKIVLRESVSLKGNGEAGGLYAGNLCMGGMNPETSHIDGPANIFAGSAEISFEGSGAFGEVYACGAQQKNPEGSSSGKIIRSDPEKYTVGGTVTVRLTNRGTARVNGVGSGGTHVVYNGNGYLTDGLTLTGLSSLRVESGYLVPALGSGFREGAAVGIASGGKLGLMNFGDLTVDSFSGGGTLLLGEGQTLAVAGEVTGSTEVSVCGSEGHPAVPAEEHIYIRAPQSGEDAFTLAPPKGYEMMWIARDTDGNWSIPAGSIPTAVLVNAFEIMPPAQQEQSGIFEAEFSLRAEYAENSAPVSYMAFIPLEITVNGAQAGRTEEDGYYAYTAEAVRLEVIPEGEMEYLIVTASSDSIPDGTYVIEITVPASNTGAGQTLWARAVLTVGDGGTQPEFTYAIENIAVTDTAVTVSVSQLPGAEDGVIYAASYGEDGRMCSIAAVPVREGGQVTVPLDSAGARWVSAFITGGETMGPLCENQSVSKS